MERNLRKELVTRCSILACVVLLVGAVGFVGLETVHGDRGTQAQARRYQAALVATSVLAVCLGISMVISAARREVAARRIAAGSELQRASLARRELEARDVRLRFEQCDARVLIDNAMLPFRSQALGRAIRLRSVVPIGLAVHADPERIQQVLQLLLSVALRNARIGGEITTVVQTVDGWIRFSVGDSGPNSVPDEVTHLFDGELSHAGTGGAPVLSRKLVEAHHGQMGVDTSPGRGHTFWFALPNQPTLLT